MKESKIITAVVLLFSSLTLSAQPGILDMRTSAFLFRAQEVSLDLFGTLSIGQETIDNLSGDRVYDDGRAGAGVGVSYFFTRHIGIGADAFAENTDRAFVDSASGNLILRLPIESIRLAPYIYGGGGHQFDPIDRDFGQVGAGLDFRFTRRWGLFFDARYLMMSEGSNIGLGRLGMRFAF